MKGLKLCGIALAVFAAGGRAQAQSSPPLTPSGNDQAPPEASCPGEPAAACPAPAPAPAPQPEPSVTVQAPPEQSWIEMYGFGISAGGGVSAFANSAMTNQTGTGGDWNVRAILGTRAYLAFELAYIGSAQSINSLGLSNNADLLGNGAQGNIRLNATTHYVVQPFIFTGAAWRFYSLHNTSTINSDVASSTNVFELPLGVGLATKYEGFMFDARGEYRWAWGQDLIPAAGNLSLNRWDVTGNIGYEF